MTSKKFKVYYSLDNPDPEKAGKQYKPSRPDMLVMNNNGIFFVYSGEAYYPSITTLTRKIGNYDIIWKEQNDS
jgi:hypothetical protein